MAVLTYRDLVVDALTEIGIAGATLEVSAEDLVLGLSKLNRILDGWNAVGQAVYAQLFTTWALVPGLNPQTIGPSGVCTLAQRPESIESVMLIISTYRYFVLMHDADWWATLPDPVTETSQPTDAWYSPEWPNGKLYLNPVPSSAYSMQIQHRVTLSQVTATDTFSLPPGYRDALTLTLAESLCGPMRVDPPALLPRDAQKARARVFEANVPTPALATTDFGLPTGRPAWFNWRSGTWLQ